MVNHKIENVKYVAKKVLLEGLPAKEQSSCMLEAGLLKNLVHPNIVEYKESFLGNNSLVIIMEWCEGKFQQFLVKHLFYSRRLGLPYQEKDSEGRVVY